MKTKLVLLVLAVVLTVLAGCEGFSRTTVERDQALVQDLTSDLSYFMDGRPNPPICYAYMWRDEGLGDAYAGGPALATVPCEAVRHLLVNRNSASGVVPSLDDGTGIDRQGL
jgi:hypothetical protein